MREAQPMRSSWEPEFTALPDRCCGPKAEVYAQLVRIGSIQALAEVTMSINRKLSESVCYFTAPAVRPRTMCFSMMRPITSRGVIAAVARAAIVHQRVPCELVCPANRSGRVGAGQDHRKEVFVPGEDERKDERCHETGGCNRNHNAKERLPNRSAIYQGCLFQLDGNRIELIAHDPDYDR